MAGLGAVRVRFYKGDREGPGKLFPRVREAMAPKMVGLQVLYCELPLGRSRYRWRRESLQPHILGMPKSGPNSLRHAGEFSLLP